jgi:UDP-N-acetylglucosamine 2-epimerase (non-hydrolysing)
MSQATIVTIVGTRPEIIRLSRVLPAMDAAFNHILVHTGQNTDPNLSEIFFKELDIRKPDYYLDVDTSSLGSVLGDTLKKVEKVFLDHTPDGVLILGDTNSAISAVLAKRMQIPVYHMEAGNRSFDENVPEETNRRLVDHASDFNLPYTEHARRNLLSEGIHPRRVMVTGSPMREVLDFYRDKIDASGILTQLGMVKNEYFLVSAHRQENVDSPERLSRLLDSLKTIHSTWNFPVLVSTHPRTRKQLEALPGFSEISGITFHEPFGFLAYNKLQMNAKCVLSDSGTISEESILLNFPAITIRDSMERPEALDVGGIIMSGLSTDDVLQGVNAACFTDNDLPREIPQGYEVQDVSRRVVRIILSTLKRHHEWAGLRYVSSPKNN